MIDLVVAWWMYLVAISVLNIVAWTWLYLHVRRQDLKEHPARSQIQAMAYLSAVYVFVCAFRSVLPRADVQTITLFDTWLASVFVGRSLATIAEICFTLQWAILILYLARTSRSRFAEVAAYCAVALIACAEVFSWYAVITTDYFGNVLEESLWTVTFLLIASSFLVLQRAYHGRVRAMMITTMGGLFAYATFMLTVDVPMYFHRWQADVAAGKELLGFTDGLTRVATSWIVTRDVSVWHQELPWMALYFSVAVWASIGLWYLALYKHHLPNYLRR